MLDKSINEFLKGAGPIFFVTPTLGRAIGLETVLPDFHIICAQTSDLADMLRAKGAKVLCLGRDIKNSGKLIGEKAVLDYIRQNSVGRQANILTFKPSPMIELVCRKNKLRYLGNDSKLNRDWEDKVKFAEITGELGVPNADSRVLKVEQTNIAATINLLKFSDQNKYVIQFPRGYSGNSTLLVETEDELEKILEENVGRKIKISKFQPGDTYTFDVCIGDFGTLISQPILQITGFAEFNRNLLGTCGNDYAYGRNLDAETKERLELSIRNVAERLKQTGYRGVAGFDFVVGHDTVDLIEVNPRLVGSMPVFTELQLSAGELPFLLLHTLSFLGFDFRNFASGKSRQDFEFSQVLLRNTQAEARRVSKALPSGIYALDGGVLLYRRKEYAAPGNLAPDEFFLECALAGETIDPDMEYANIQLPCGIMETGNRFRAGFLALVGEVFQNIQLT
jgi:hypothetical protein